MMKIPRMLLAAGLLATASLAQADLQRFGPVTPSIGGYPAWFQDRSGLALDFGTPLNQSELSGGWLLILPADVPTGAAPETPFTNYSEEHFYWNATSAPRANGAVLVMALEGAFANGAPAAGDQMVFGRIRIRISSVPTSGDYKVYTPFGVYDFPGMVAGERLFSTQDVGVTCIATFTCTLDARIGPFLLPSKNPGGAEVPPIPDLRAGQDPFYDALATKTPYPGTGRKYTADPARIGPLTGGTCTPTVLPDGVAPQPGDCVIGNAVTDPPNGAGGFLLPARPVYVTSSGLRDPNIFRIEVNGVELPPGTGTEHDFSTIGRINTSPVAGLVTVDRASYRVTGGAKVDVYATAFPTTSPRVPGAAAAQVTAPDLSFYAAECGIAPVTSVPTAPATGTPVQMFNTGSRWWGQMVPATLAKLPSAVCVVDNSLVVPSYHPALVTDEVNIAAAVYDPSTSKLTVDAVPSDCRRANNPALTLNGFGGMTRDATGCNFTLSVPNLLAPPTRVTVTSVHGGVASLDVRSEIGTPTVTNVVDTTADSATIQEDCSATPAASCATPLVLDVLANDNFNGVPVRNAALATVPVTPVLVTIVTPPANGTATVDGNGNVVYTPNPNFNGTDLVGYAVTYGALPPSAAGYVHVTVTPVNDQPVAVNDTAGAPANVAVTLNLLANDTDPDGQADLAGVRITALPTPATATLSCGGVAITTVPTDCAGGQIAFTGTAAATSYSFRYRAKDLAGALSATPAATATVTTTGSEAIVLSRAVYTIKSGRWQIDGTDNVAAGQTLSIRYDLSTGPTYRLGGVCTAMTPATNPVIGTATVDAAGAWAYDATVALQSALNPTNTGNVAGFWCTPPRRLSITSPLGGSRTGALSTK